MQVRRASHPPQQAYELFSAREPRAALKRVSKVSDPEYEYMSTGGSWKQNNTKMKMMTMMMRT